MPEVIDLKNVVEDIVSSYEERIESIGSIFDTVYSILGDFQGSIADIKEEREKIGNQVRDILAKNEHLRKKDFDNMMQGILKASEQREKEVRDLLNGYFNEQKTMAQALRESLGKFKDSLARGEAERVKEFQALIKDLLSKQEERKEGVTSKLKRFQQQHNKLIVSLRELLAKGGNLRIKDFKIMLKEFKVQREERLTLQRKRKKEVAKMLSGFREKRLPLHQKQLISMLEAGSKNVSNKRN
ncbi:MAG: hypothetical protein A3I04_04870 [Nitrospinae bacterium RIFCSPLOWO2_02_FULL_39_110]|nr:MAG: hypothetical protein A3D97_03395 [Nitrospinae bacterium RIFCSPHIGHO2_12_FULL_39_42]OGW03134.1 MAG: hypothetical protein A3D20_00005 [Nitrospinae bacterium RIFCSPHIGHO2_02_FULL_39_82]OGW04196.1 MAG: hypothetical protein A3I04_04870 [Nitrospinae bacterium RIFCSPLOWO2_02_FULL_39_110]OGW05679.1 MAG: hypothetical protein A2Z59_01545 [Nitrospinae bacterium RIFCSPLOWO2_02_39_17]OGW07545.1 MAG: hypothetical protein A2W75_02855 [Nitrospinae bacterium RIFCSPLOWO2_12_39_15]OGW08310.1 MAG: hypothe